MNETINAIMSRSSIRKFKSTKLNEEQIQTLMKAALAAPSAANRQPWHFNFVEDTDSMLDLENYLVELAMNSGDKVAIERLLSRNKKILFDAPLIVFVTSKLDGHFDMLDCGIAIENIVIAAQSMNLSSVILGGMRVAFTGEKKAYYEEKFKFPKGYQFVAAVAIGYADMNSAPHALDETKVTRV
ncbi:nitroreductase family protein [Clostridium sp. SYSU_GA19001]|uniref:nitroreductase family protein n=1 Tax=Clostridium caldaquaticum TaxID=2940653 RepID=UPI0020775F5D|nr:nitroreductase family protein [Clostridium caldaquaticum]MCM8709968.1 nitroreductase family protein [Clostridium caldaquaticum]